MDYHDLQRKLFELDPTDPREDLAKLKSQAHGGAVADVPPTKDYVNESVQVPQGSMPLGLDSIADFAALAGIKVNEAQKHGDYARGKDPMPSVSKPSRSGEQPHPLKDKLVGERDINPVRGDSTFGEISDTLRQFGSDMGLKGVYLNHWGKSSFNLFMNLKMRQDTRKARKTGNLKDIDLGEDDNTAQNPELDVLIDKFLEKGMPKKAARMFAQIAYMHFNNDRKAIGASPEQMQDTDFQDLMRQAKGMDDLERSAPRESTTESIKDRLYAALKDYK